MIKMKIFTLVLGVIIIGVAEISADESESTSPDDGPIASQENNVEQRRVDVPEVVLQLKYDKGELNRIYLTQFRKDSKAWVPSVSARSNLCADLCHAGLGGEACGVSICSQLIPIGLQTALRDANRSDVTYGVPRYNVCPSLCQNQLGAPLCNCKPPTKEHDHAVNWSEVCAAFCYDGYTLNGCPTCESSSTEATVSLQSSRVLSTYEGWAAWCNVQCRQGQGGAACNCDRTPFQ
ncbi:uncharacterized protein LOC111349912 [Spodoptera litura]|uniref:Uncharacterized protein LOC111349912 n=1 Tax=Spodoptera litura TaxID=69820 RepID=A0A9J7DVT4_SPOLT|nr:uncharacterized protein LOC111349912 [Spodoptera litura]XP_022817022.1 uncharacterized protein LOC111349912 [Spodoptera litura]